MYLLNEFARKQGSKDKKQRLKRGLQIAGGLAATGLIAGLAYKNRNKITNLLNKTKNKKTQNSNKVKERLTKIQEQLNKQHFDDIDITKKPKGSLERINKRADVRAAVKTLKNKNEYFKSNNYLSKFYD